MKKKCFEIMFRQFRKPTYKVCMFLLGLPTFIVALISYAVYRSKHGTSDKQFLALARKELEDSGRAQSIYEECRGYHERKLEFFHKNAKSSDAVRQLKKQYSEQLNAAVRARADELMEAQGAVRPVGFMEFLQNALNRSTALFVLSVISSLPLYILMIIDISPFGRYAVERIFFMVFVIFGVVLLCFTVMHFSAFDPAQNILGEKATEEQLAQFNETYGLDEPYMVQLGQWFKKIVTFDLGKSYSSGEDVFTSLIRKFPATLKLALFAAIFAIVVALPLGVMSSLKPNSGVDYVALLIAMILMSVPSFWLGMIMILNFSINTGWLPSTFKTEQIASYIMPAVAMSCSLLSSITRITRSSMLEVSNQEYITTARAKGLSMFTVVMKHMFLNALIPVITAFGLQFGHLLGGSAVTEKVFSVKGIGNYIISSVYIPDIPIVLSGVVYLAIIISLLNLVIDLLYAVLDPRIKASLKNN